MKTICVALGLNSEYHGYDIYCGVGTDVESTIKQRLKTRFGNRYGEVKYVTVTHSHDDYGDPHDDKTHTHVAFYVGDYEIKPRDFESALRKFEEEYFEDVIECIKIKHETL